MKVALVAPSGVPFVVGGAEKLWWGLTQHVNQHTTDEMELIKLPSPERDFWEVVASYERFAALDLSHFDAVISTKYPAWMVDHPNHVVYLQHKLRGLYDTYPAHLPHTLRTVPAPLQPLWRLLTDPRHERSQLPEVFERLRDAQQHAQQGDAQWQAWCAFPGPLSRAAVHKLDAIALRPGAIRRYLAISQVVAGRADHFPPGVPVQVLPHPSNLQGLRQGEGEFVFTASRLDGPKRIDLLVQAYRQCRAQVPLVVAGDGPQAQRLRELAAGDPRIRFAGRLSDEALIDHYARALLVPFVPHLEDMGLITLEAMGAGKPVLTVDDAGGVTEFVQDGVNGRVVEPTPRALAQALDALLADRAQLQRMGQAALQTAASVTWERTARGLLDAVRAAPEHRAANDAANDIAHSAAPAPRRLRLLVLNTFDVHPPDSGGKKRIFYLYSALARHADVTLLNLGQGDHEPELREFGPHLREVRVAPDAAFVQRDAELKAQLRCSATDMAALLFWRDLPGLQRAFEVLKRDADVVVASHVYLWPLVAAHWGGPVWYDAHNVEADMKADILGLPRLQAPLGGAAADSATAQQAQHAQHALQAVAQAEAALVQRAQRVLAVSDADRARLAALYGRAAHTMEVAANGTLVPAQPPMPGAQRAGFKQQLGWAAHTPVALFVGAHHGPNLAALETVHALAAQLPQWQFVVAGSVCGHLKDLPPHSANLHPLGVVTEAELTVLLYATDVGLNPMQAGSGTNMKMLDYASHGALVLSTPAGARGLQLIAGQHLLQHDLAQFAEALQALAAEVPGPRPEMRAAAREAVRQHYDWNAIADRVLPG